MKKNWEEEWRKTEKKNEEKLRRRMKKNWEEEWRKTEKKNEEKLRRRMKKNWEECRKTEEEWKQWSPCCYASVPTAYRDSMCRRGRPHHDRRSTPGYHGNKPGWPHPSREPWWKTAPGSQSITGRKNGQIFEFQTLLNYHIIFYMISVYIHSGALLKLNKFDNCRIKKIYIINKKSLQC